MSETVKGINLIGMITPNGDADNNIATHEDRFGKGGYMVADRTKIPYARRKEGMLVYDKGTIYKCIDEGTDEKFDATWEELKLGGFNSGVVATASHSGYVPVAKLVLTSASGDYSTLFALHSSHDQDVFGLFFAQFYYSSTWLTSNSNIRWEIKSTSAAIPTDLISAYYQIINNVTTITLYYKISDSISKYTYGLATTQLSNVTSYNKVQDLKWEMLINQPAVTTPPGTKLATSTLSTIANNISGNAATATRAKVAEKIEEVGANDKSSTSATTYDRFNPNLLDKHKFRQLHNFNNINQWKNMPSGFLFGSVIHFGCETSGSLVGQLAYDVSGGDQAKTNNLYFRTGNPNYRNSSITTQEQAWNLSTWKRIAWASELSRYVPIKNQDNSIAIGDANKIITSGFWRMSSKRDNPNLPGYGQWGQLIVSGVSNTPLQIYGDYYNNDLYFRSGVLSNGELTETWQKVVSETSGDRRYVKKTGDTMSGSLVLSYNGTPYSFGVAYNDNDSVERRLTNADLVIGFTGQNTAFRTVFNRSSQQTYSYNGSDLSFEQYNINPLGGNVQVGPAATTTTVGISSASITYNKTTGCLEITA